MGQALPESRLAAQNKGTNPSTPRSNRVVSRPPQFLATDHWQLAPAVGRLGRSGPPLCGGTPPATPPCVCQRACASPAAVSAPAVSTPPSVCVGSSAVRVSTFRVPIYGRSDRSGPPLCGGHPPQRPPVAMPPCVSVPSWRVSDQEVTPPCLRLSCLCTSASEGMPPRPQLACQSHPRRCHRACAVPAYRRRAADTTLPCARGSRGSNCDSRITTHKSRLTKNKSRPFRPSLVRGAPPQRPLVAMPPCVRLSCLCTSASEGMPPLPQLACQSHPGRCHRACTVPAYRRRAADTTLTCARGSRSSNCDSRLTTHDSRLTTHESRITAKVDFRFACLYTKLRRRNCSEVSPQAVAFLPRGVSFFLSLKRILHRGERAHVR